jgi:DNA-directed RNA polymerase subunit H (RpoH/RPB5)
MEVTKPIKKNLIQVVMNNNQIKETVILNIIKMLYNRGIVNKSNIDFYKTTAYNQLDQNDETFFNLDNEESQKMGNKTVCIKFINRKITTIRKVIDIETFMDNTGYKFVIVNNIAPKASKQITEYKQTELFYDYELLINLVDHVLVPKHTKLDDIYRELFMASYQISEGDLKNLKRMYIDDPISRYYNLSIGDIVKIERPSLTSGICVDYRQVVIGSINK